MMLAIALLWLQSPAERAQSLLREGKLAEARAVVEAAQRGHPHSVPAQTMQGRQALAENNFDLARASFEKAAALEPNSAATQFLLGFFYYVDNDFRKAQPTLERARKLAPQDPRTALFLALTHEGLAEPDRAAELFEETFRLEARAGRQTVEAHVAYARMLFANGRLDEAQLQTTKALNLNPEAPEALYEQARIDFERGRYANCIASAERALGHGGAALTARQIHFLLSRAYSRTGDHVRAAEHRRRFEAIAPRLIR
jgi:tetratricopeptide (TPR) repeat protein